MDSSFTGRPSRVHDVVALAAGVLARVLRPVGGVLATVRLRIPFVTDGVPRAVFTRGVSVTRTDFHGMPVLTLVPPEPSGRIVVAVHGGAYVGRATFFHWWTYAGIARETGATVHIPDYTLAPIGTALTEVPRMADFIARVVSEDGAVGVLGDSAGGGLALLAVQELVRRGGPTPNRLVLLAPWLDVSMGDPRSAAVDDPLLDVDTMIEDGRLWAGDLDPRNPLASPLFGPLHGLPPTAVYCSSRDRLSIDVLRLRDRVTAEDVPDVTFRLRAGLLHDYVMYAPLPDAKAERVTVYADLGC
ncbi:alpha/beta hydrolase fold domain-containing protein [Mycolicibacterium arenosum]|uniref:Alpha/beta hydrolase n=1 Tax=Mycolicibacterium arenosum TaxID=2952157 RepID=A0ABT1M1A6_9MYCO|nr:alpha/beta hydrolase fold domain-containing protein [Mycolicibacterium sp. CAU 1645]MCP9272928.1 alpha/beta hydrolase [Mycolicibacterium sp. CAU 1645]